MIRRLLLSLATVVSIMTSAGATAADEWPRGPVRVIVPFAPGSTPDTMGRILADKLQQRLGAPFIVENKPGASGNIGTDAVAKAAPDGQTIGISIAGPLAVNTLLYKNLPYDPAHDLTPVSIAATQPSVLVTTPALHVSNMDELLALLKKNPGKYNFSSMGVGSISHLAMETVAARSGTEIVHVPYPGSAQAVAALLAGDAQMACLPAAAVIPQIKAGKLVALAVATPKRAASLPELPTLAEAGLKDVQADAWMGVVVPAKTPASIVDRLQHEVAAIMALPDVQEKLKGQFMEPVANTSAEFKDVLKRDLTRWKPVIEKHHISLD